MKIKETEKIRIEFMPEETTRVTEIVAQYFLNGYDFIDGSLDKRKNYAIGVWTNDSYYLITMER